MSTIWATLKDLRTKSIETPSIQVGRTIQISLGAIKEITSGNHKHYQDLEDRMCSNLNLNFNKIKFHSLKVQWRARWRNHGCDVIKDEPARQSLEKDRANDLKSFFLYS